MTEQERKMLIEHERKLGGVFDGIVKVAQRLFERQGDLHSLLAASGPTTNAPDPDPLDVNERDGVVCRVFPHD